MRPVFYPVALVFCLFFSTPGLLLPSGEINPTRIQNERAESLIRALANEDAETRMKAAETLGDLSDTRAVLPLIRALRDSNFRVQLNAALALGKIGDVQAIESLIEALLRNSVVYVREAAAKALGDIGDKRAVLPLFIALGDSETAVSRAAGNSLKKLDEPGGYLLYEALYVSGSETIKRIRKEHIPRLFDIALKAFDRWDSKTRENVVWALGSIHNEKTIDFLITILSDPYSGVRTAAVWSLGKIGGKQTISPLLKALDDQSPFVQEAAVWTLGDTHENSVVEPLIKTLDDKNPKIREAALWSLRKIGDQRAAEHAINALDDPERKVRIAAAWTIHKLGDKSAFESLIVALNDMDAKVREAAILSLGKIGDRRALSPIIKTLSDNFPAVKIAAAQTLGHIGDFHVVNHLIIVLKDENLEVRKTAAIAIEKLMGPQGQLLSESLQGSEKALKDLVDKQDHRISTVFMHALENRRSDIRCIAAHYLGEVKETRAMQGLSKISTSWNFKDRYYGMAALKKLKLAGIYDNFSLAINFFLSRSSTIYFLIATVLFGLISLATPIKKKKHHFATAVAIGCLGSGFLITLPAISLTWTYLLLLLIGILPFMCTVLALFLFRKFTSHAYTV